tara:strand:- start:4982 stop:5836 length:855 start_codon:yes stop_codon:yes gene_type:complete
MKRLNPKHKKRTRKKKSKADILHSTDKIKTLKGLWAENKEQWFKKSYKVLRRNRHWVRVALTVCLIVSFVALSGVSYRTGFHQGVEQWLKLTSKIHQMTAQQEAQRQQSFVLNKQLSSLQQKHAIQKVEYQKLSEQVKQLFNENAELKEDNLLYQHIMGKPHPKRGLAVQRLQLYPTQNTNTFQYQLMLISTLTHKKLIQGHVEVVVRGKIGGKEISMLTKYLPTNNAETSLAFKFKDFQELSGEMILPNGFEPKSVMVHIKPTQQVKLARQQIFPWWIDTPES